MNGVAVMKYRKFFCAFLLAAALLCACGQDRTAPNEPAPGPSDQAEAQPIFWNDLRWDEHLELVYAQNMALQGSPLTASSICWSRRTWALRQIPRRT